MSLAQRRREADDAERLLALERRQWRADTVDLRARAARHREALTVGGGFAGGVVAGLLPLGALLGAGDFVVGASTLLLRNLYPRD